MGTVYHHGSDLCGNDCRDVCKQVGTQSLNGGLVSLNQSYTTDLTCVLDREYRDLLYTGHSH